MDDLEERFLDRAEEDYEAFLYNQKQRGKKKMTEQADIFEDEDFDDTAKTDTASQAKEKTPAKAASNGSAETKRGRKPKPEAGSPEALLEMYEKVTGPIVASLAGKILAAPDTAEVDELVDLPKLKMMAASLVSQSRGK